MFDPRPLNGGNYEIRKYMSHFWYTLQNPYALYLASPRGFDLAWHYASGTGRRIADMSCDEMNDVEQAMKIAQRAFLEFGLMAGVRCNVETQLRSALANIDGYVSPGSIPSTVPRLAEAVLVAVRHGKLIHVPEPEELHACVKAIQEDRNRQPVTDARQSLKFDPREAARQMMGRPPRMPSGLDTPLSGAQPFDYQPDMPDSDVEQLAGGEGTPGNNQAQNKQFKSVVKVLGLDKGQARQLHEEISGEGLGYHEIMERAHDLFGGGQ